MRKVETGPLRVQADPEPFRRVGALPVSERPREERAHPARMDYNINATGFRELARGGNALR